MPAIMVLDTSVLLAAGKKALYSFEQNDLVIPYTVLKELESKKTDPELGRMARSVIKELDKFNEQGDIKTGVSLGEGFGTVRVEVNHIDQVPDILSAYPSNDTKIVTVASYLKHTEDQAVILVSKDIALRIIATLVDVESQDFTPNFDGNFIDRVEMFTVPSSVINEIHAEGDVKLTLKVPINAGIILRSEENPKHTALAIAKADYSFEIIDDQTVKGLESHSAEQAIAIEYLMDPKIKIVSLGGRAGTGKTTLALAAGIEQLKDFKKITVFRSMHAVGGEELGFLPGTEQEKMDPWTQAIYDSLESFLEKQQIQGLKAKGLIEVLPLTHIRGRTLHNRFVIVDEAQNLHKDVLMTALSRLGKNSKAVLSWDAAQRDNMYVGRFDGVYEVASRLLGEKLFGHVSLQRSERSDVADLVTRKLDDINY
jgi:PhoH-like ATPase